jgi:hypothetical protein
MIGHPGSAKGVIELEYWRGPLFDADISRIPSGVTEYKASERSRFFEGVDRTQFWWKAPETRREDGRERAIRTLEAEELVENPSPALSGDLYGCRYVHAEYDSSLAEVTHFDGAIRAYSGAAYLERIERSIDRAGKQSQYTKLFRFDGPLPVETWKSLVADYYRGNDLVGEYFSGLKTEPVQASRRVATELAAPDPQLAALVAYGFPVDWQAQPAILCETMYPRNEGEPLDYVELPPGALGKLARSYVNVETTALVLIEDGIANFPALSLGDTPAAHWSSLLQQLASALRSEIAEGNVARASFVFNWRHGGIAIALSCAGDAANVAAFLDRVQPIISFDDPPSSWLPQLKQAVIDCSFGEEAAYDALSFYRFGEPLRIPRPDTKVRMIVPEEKASLFEDERKQVDC